MVWVNQPALPIRLKWLGDSVGFLFVPLASFISIMLMIQANGIPYPYTEIIAKPPHNLFTAANLVYQW